MHRYAGAQLQTLLGLSFAGPRKRDSKCTVGHDRGKQQGPWLPCTWTARMGQLHGEVNPYPV